MNQAELNKIIADHKLWLRGNGKGKRANLRSADLRYADLIYIGLDRYYCIISKTHTHIGCQRQTNKFWLNCKVSDISGFSGDATEWWNNHGKLIRQLIKKVQIKAGKK